MSLNGLDNLQIKEAHDAAVAEPGGWYDDPPSPPPIPMHLARIRAVLRHDCGHGTFGYHTGAFLASLWLHTHHCRFHDPSQPPGSGTPFRLYYYSLASAVRQTCRRLCANRFTNRFLLKYASRDEIEMLGRGNGGIVEIRNAISEYDETSPLYGFLRYRRRNVLIKYLPEDCSRLIQGRSCP